MKRKIAIVNVFFPPQSIGGATRVVADNVDVLIDLYADDFDLVFFTSDAAQQPPHTIQVHSHKGRRVYRAGVLWREHMDWQPRDAEMGKLFGQFLDFEKPDLVHFHSIQRLTGSIVEATIEREIPYLITAHDAWWISDYQFLVDESGTVYPQGHPDPFEEIPTPKGISKDQSLERRSYLKSLMDQARSVPTVSESFANIYRINGAPQVVVNKNGIQPRKWLPRTPSASGKVRVAHIGGMSKHKGYHLFKKALHSHPFQNIEALVVDHGAPTGDERHEMWGTVPVTLIGKVPQDRIEELYARMDVLFAPSIWPESYGLVTREASAAGVWVAASNIGGIGEDVIPSVTGDLIDVDQGVPALLEILKRLETKPLSNLDGQMLTHTRTVSEQVASLPYASNI